MCTAAVAGKAGVHVQTLRYYERLGLLAEPDRLESGYRTYGPEAVRIVRFVNRAQQPGFTLEEIESLPDLAAGGPDSCNAARLLATDVTGRAPGSSCILPSRPAHREQALAALSGS